MTTPVAIVVGAGPGLGAALARRFARGGCAVGLVARREASWAPALAAIEAAGGRGAGATGDVGDEASLLAALDRLARALGEPDALVYNASGFDVGGALELDAAAFERAWRVGCFGAFVAARRALPPMVARGRGTLLFTGATASLRGGARFAAFAAGKFALRALAQSLAREVQPKGVHVAHVIVDGAIGRAGAAPPPPAAELDPDAIAETYWHLHAQPPSAWTFELELRPSGERF
jgi:NAD(P)-dependent dehydrogenase (short-subunit alcohol dehydrogenase family)